MDGRTCCSDMALYVDVYAALADAGVRYVVVGRPLVAAAVRTPVGDRRVPVAALEHLITMKRAA